MTNPPLHHSPPPALAVGGQAAVKTVTLTVGQAISWRPSPCGIAQICELRRSRVRVCYISKQGRPRFALVRVRDLDVQPLLFEMNDPFNRGRILRSKTFIL